MPYKDRRRQQHFQRTWLREKRAAWIASQGGKCVQCGSESRLEVDHINPEQKADHRVWSWSAERRAAELAKCQVLCKRCHGKKSGRERWADAGLPADFPE